MKKDELSLIKDIRNRFPFPEGIGIGDDSAVLKIKESALITTDLMIEDVHFDLGFTSFYHLGFKIVSVNVSDIYAMGGDFRVFLFSLGVPQTVSDEELNDLFNGINDALNYYRGFLIGGDLSKSEKIVLSGVAIGETEKPILRKVAEPEDQIFITSYLGLSQAGFYLLRNLSEDSKNIVKSIKNFDLLSDFSESLLSLSESFPRHFQPFIAHSEQSEESYIKMTHTEGDPSAIPQGDRKKCHSERSEESHAKELNLPQRKIQLKEIKESLKRHLMPVARKPDKLRNTVKAMMDISDGLLIDLHRLCEESGVGAEIYIDKIPIHPEVAKVAELFNIDPMKIILSGGEDYELLVISDKGKLTETGLIPIGKIIKNKGIYVVDPMKGKFPAKPEGWQHF